MALRFEDMLERLGTQGRESVLNTYRLYQAGLIDQSTFIDVASELLQHINERSAVFGELSYSQVRAIILEGAPDLATVTAPAPATTQQGLSQSLHTIVEGDPDTIVTRLERLASVLPMESAQDSYGKALQRDPVAQGWLRGLDQGACQLCRWWWREGRIWPKRHPMPKHKGCKCQQIPQIGSIAPTQYTKKLERREAAIKNRDRRSIHVRRGALSESEVAERLQNIE